MKLRIQKTELLKALGHVQGIVEKKTTMPILTNVLFEAKNSIFSITATDLEVGINGTYSAEILSEGSIAVHAKSIYDIVKELPDEMISLTVLDGNRLKLECAKSSFNIVGLPSEEFPVLPKKGSGKTNNMDSSFLSDMIDRTSFAMSTDETRYNLNGVFLDVIDGAKDAHFVRMVATDGHRLSIVERKMDAKLPIEKGVIIPRKGCYELKKLAESSDSPMNIWADAKYVIVYKDNLTLVVRLIDGQFPPYEQVIPKKLKRVASVDKAIFKSALKRVSILSTEKARGVKFHFSPKNLDIFISNPDMGDAREEVTAKYRGDSFEIAFNAKYILDILNVIDDDIIVLQLGDETSPCVIKSELDTGLTHVIMPMRL